MTFHIIVVCNFHTPPYYRTTILAHKQYKNSSSGHTIFISVSAGRAFRCVRLWPKTGFTVLKSLTTKLVSCTAALEVTVESDLGKSAATDRAHAWSCGTATDHMELRHCNWPHGAVALQLTTWNYGTATDHMELWDCNWPHGSAALQLTTWNCGIAQCSWVGWYKAHTVNLIKAYMNWKVH